jgi:hypothetical protein
MEESKIEAAARGLAFAKDLTDCICVRGVENCKRLAAVHDNLERFLNLLAAEGTAPAEDPRAANGGG